MALGALAGIPIKAKNPIFLMDRTVQEPLRLDGHSALENKIANAGDPLFLIGSRDAPQAIQLRREVDSKQTPQSITPAKALHP